MHSKDFPAISLQILVFAGRVGHLAGFVLMQFNCRREKLRVDCNYFCFNQTLKDLCIVQTWPYV